MNESQSPEPVFAFLSDPATHGGAAVKRIDTHAASVFLAGPRAFKVKRAVRFPFLDYSTLAKRKAACEAELKINQPLAAQIYRRVVPITRSADGGLQFDGEGAPVEWAVEMRRFDESATLDHLAEAGIEYIGDWVLDDEPVSLKTSHGPVVALPYNFELHDIVMMALQHHPSEMMYRRAMDHFACLYEESAERAKIMAIACHPYLSGVPHRIAHVRRAFEEILGRDGVVAWDGARILDWYLAQSGART